MRGLRLLVAGIAWSAVAVLGPAGPAYAQGDGVDSTPREVTGEEQRGVILRVLGGRFSLHVNGSYQAASRRYERSAGFSAYGEEARFVARHEFAGGVHVDVGGTFRVWRELAVGASYTEMNNPGTALVSGTVPHPLYFDRDRTASTEAPALPHRERATHVQIAWRRALRDGLDVAFSAGPTYFNLLQGRVTGLTVHEAGGPTLDDVDLRVGTDELLLNGIGFNAGIDVTFMLAHWLGVGYFARVTAGSVEAPQSPLSPELYYVGGFQTGLGLRLRF